MNLRYGLAWLLPLLSLAFLGCDGGNSNEDPTGQAPPVVETGEAPTLARDLFPALGATAFMSANENELLSAGMSGAQYGANARGELDDSMADADGAAGGEVDPGGAEPVPDVSREIVEADVFKLEGDRLYILNRYRGLVIIDVSDPDDLRIAGRLPFQAVPIEMYVRDGRAYILNSDYFTYWQFDPEADPHGFHGSEVMVVDVEDASAPVLLGRQQIDGEITDSRMVGDVLYTVSKRRPDYWRYNTADWEDRTWIASLNIADPTNIRQVDRVTFQGMSTLIHVAHHAIFVAAWDPNFYLTDSQNEQETLVTYVDISDEHGAIETRGHVYIPGTIADKFKMDWYDGALRVFSQRWQHDATVTLHVVNTDRPDDLEIDASLELQGVTRSGLLATRFDGERAFAMTREYLNRTTVRELHTIDLSDVEPAQMARLRIETDVTHFEVHGDRLLAFGRHYIQNRDSRTAISLFNIADLAQPSLVERVRLGEGYSSSEASSDYKAFKTFPALDLILVPLNYWTNNTSFTGVQLVEWTEDGLEARGRVENEGGVRRAFPVGDRLVAVGDYAVSTMDAADRDHPRLTDSLRLVRNVNDIFKVQGLEVQMLTDLYDGGVRIEVRAFGPDDDTPALASLDLPYSYAPYALQDGDMIHLIGWETAGGQTIRTIDLSDPMAPALRGRLLLDGDLERIHSQGMGYYSRYWSPSAGLPLRNQILPVTFRRVVESATGRRDFESTLRFIDLRDADHPRIAEGGVPMNDFPFINKVTHGQVLYSSHVEQATTQAGESLLYHVRSYVDRVDVTDPDQPVALPSVNIPGYLVDVSDDGRLWYTVDYQWDDFGRRRNSLNVLRVAGDTAVLVEVVPVGDQINRAALRSNVQADSDGELRPVGFDDRTVWLTAHKYPWWGVRSDTVSSRQPYTILRKLQFSDGGALAGEAQSRLHGYHFDLLDVVGDRAWFASNQPYGLLALDVSDAMAPVIEHAARTIGYLSRIVVDEGNVYAPMGYFGVHQY